MNNLLTRTLTGFFLVLIVLGGIWFHPITFLLVGLSIMLGSQIELNSLLFKGGHRAYLYKGFLLSIPAFLASPLVATGLLQAGIYLLLIPLLVFILISELYNKKSGSRFEDLSKGLFSTVYTALPYVLMVFMAFNSGGEKPGFSPLTPVVFFILLWINDTGAYLVGMAAGRHKLLERISPKKTWEGLLGGIVLTLAAAFFVPHFLQLYTRSDWLIIDRKSVV